MCSQWYQSYNFIIEVGQSTLLHKVRAVLVRDFNKAINKESYSSIYKETIFTLKKTELCFTSYNFPLISRKS